MMMMTSFPPMMPVSVLIRGVCRLIFSREAKARVMRSVR